MRHAPFPIGPVEREAWLVAMLAAVDESGAPPAALAAFREYFEMASTAMINVAR
jgi:hemoglobin